MNMSLRRALIDAIEWVTPAKDVIVTGYRDDADILLTWRRQRYRIVAIKVGDDVNE